MRGEQISMTQNQNGDFNEFPVLDAQLSATAMTFMGTSIPAAFEDDPVKVDAKKNPKKKDEILSNRAVHNEEKEPAILTPEERAALRRLVFKQFTDPLDDMYFKVASKDILAVNRQFIKELNDKELKIGKYLPCDEIIKENIKEYRPFMNQTFDNVMTPEMFALKQLGMPIEFNHVSQNAKAA